MSDVLKRMLSEEDSVDPFWIGLVAVDRFRCKLFAIITTAVPNILVQLFYGIRAGPSRYEMRKAMHTLEIHVSMPPCVP